MHNMRERERVRDSGSNANINICFEVRAPSSTSPPSHRRIFTITSTQDFPHREPPLRIWVNTNREYTTPLSINTTSHQRQGTTQITSTLRGQALSQTKINPITSHQRDITKNGRFTTWCYLSTTKYSCICKFFFIFCVLLLPFYFSSFQYQLLSK